MKHAPQPQSFDREDGYREQLTHVEDTLAAIVAKELEQQKQLEETRTQKRQFEIEQRRLKSEIGRELSERYQTAKEAQPAADQSRGETAKRGGTVEGKDGSKIVAKSQIEKLESLVAKPSPQPKLSPPGVRQKVQGARDRELERLAEEMREQLREQERQAKQAFENAAKKGMNQSKGRGR